MSVNRDKPDLWKQDVLLSVDEYNRWFMEFAPTAYREQRAITTEEVKAALQATVNLTNVQPTLLRESPSVLPTLRMATCPPIAVDRLVGLAGVQKSLVKSMDKHGRIPPRMKAAQLDQQLAKIAAIIEEMADPDIFGWLGTKASPTDAEIERAATIVADRLCGARTNPIIRNAQEQRQLALIKAWLEARGYKLATPGTSFKQMDAGTFSFRMNVQVTQVEGEQQIEDADDEDDLTLVEDEGEQASQTVNIPIDAVIKPLDEDKDRLPILIEAKSAGDFTNPNKRRKEEAVKMAQLKRTYGDGVRFNLFLCGYFNTRYLGYEAAEGIDWVWEHRIDDLAGFGL